MLLGDCLDDVVGDPCAVAETGEVELPHFSAAAHIVHQIVGVSFATDKSHDVLESAAGSWLRPLPNRSVREFHYAYQDWMRRMSKGCHSPGCEHGCTSRRKTCIGFFAASHRSFPYARFPMFRSVPYISLNTGGGERSLVWGAIPLYHLFSL